MAGGEEIPGPVKATGRLRQLAIRRTLRWVARKAPVRRGKMWLVEHARSFDGTGGPPVLSETKSGTWMVLDLQSHVERRIYYFGFYRPWVLPAFAQLVRPGDVVLDVGANVGPYALEAALLVEANGLIVAFEPEAECFERLARNLRLNQAANIRLVNAVVGRREGRASLYVHGDPRANRGQSSLVRFSYHEGVREVEAVTLDGYVEREALRDVDVIKLDAQGAELDVLRGGERVFAAHAPSVVFRCHESKCRAFGYSTVDVQQFFLDRGYGLRRVDEVGQRPVTQPMAVEDGTFVACPSSRRVVGDGEGQMHQCSSETA